MDISSSSEDDDNAHEQAQIITSRTTIFVKGKVGFIRLDEKHGLYYMVLAYKLIVQYIFLCHICVRSLGK